MRPCPTRTGCIFCLPIKEGLVVGEVGADPTTPEGNGFTDRRVCRFSILSYKMEYCIAHNPLLLQLLGHWFTFIYRKCEHLAVGSSEQGLTRSRGHLHFVVALPSPVVLLL